jgi:hypothetical protein
MGYIKEPKGVDLIIGPSTLTERDKKKISEIIAHYKRTGKKPVTGKVLSQTSPKKKKFAA